MGINEDTHEIFDTWRGKRGKSKKRSAEQDSISLQFRPDYQTLKNSLIPQDGIPVTITIEKQNDWVQA